MQFFKVCVVGSVSLLAIAGAVTATAHTGAMGVVKERMDAMSAIGDANKVLRAIFSGESPYNADTVAENAAIIQGHAGSALTELFPQGSLDTPTEAKPEIWQNWSEFSALAARLEETAKALANAAPNGPGESDAPASSMGAMMGQADNMASMMGESPSPGMEMDVDAMSAMPAGAIFAMMGDTCSACHTKFRIEKD